MSFRTTRGNSETGRRIAKAEDTAKNTDSKPTPSKRETTPQDPDPFGTSRDFHNSGQPTELRDPNDNRITSLAPTTPYIYASTDPDDDFPAPSRDPQIIYRTLSAHEARYGLDSKVNKYPSAPSHQPYPQALSEYPPETPSGLNLRRDGRSDNPIAISGAGTHIIPELPPRSLAHRPSPSPRALLPGSIFFADEFLDHYRRVPDHVVVDCKLSMDNTLSDFFLTELQTEDDLWDLVVLTGDPYQVWATTCGEYVAKTWPQSINHIKTLFEKLRHTTEDLASPANAILDDIGIDSHGNNITLASKVAIIAEKSRRELTLSARTPNQVDMIGALAWLFATLQSLPGYEGPVASGVVMNHISKRQGNAFSLEIDFLEPVSQEQRSNTCWFPLVPRSATATNFPTPYRNGRLKGIELSFELMCFLCGLEYEVLDTGGVVLRGPRSLVYPVQLVDDCVEWHFLPCDPRSSVGREIKGARLIMDDLDVLSMKPRHFLGLWADPEITLGTNRNDQDRVTWSQAEEVRRTITRDGDSIGGSIGSPKALSISWTRTFKVARCRRNIYMVDFESKLHAMKNTPVVLYCVSERRAWMVSFVSVLLYLARARASFQKEIGYHIPPCECSQNGGQAAYDAIIRCHRDSLKKGAQNETLSDEEKSLTIKDYINDVWSAMEVAKNESSKAKGFFRTQIIGYEAADIARMKPILHMKRQNLDAFATGWTPLLDEISLTLFYEGIFDPIVPSTSRSSDSPCAYSTWSRIPDGFNLLTASLPCLVDLCEHHNPDGRIWRLTSEYYWHTPGPRDIFAPCQRTSPHVCNRVQELMSDDFLRTTEIRHPSFTGLLDNSAGAVVFRYAADMRTIQRALDDAAQPRTVQSRVKERPRAIMNAAQHHRPDSGYSSPGLQEGMEPLDAFLDGPLVNPEADSTVALSQGSNAAIVQQDLSENPIEEFNQPALVHKPDTKNGPGVVKRLPMEEGNDGALVLRGRRRPSPRPRPERARRPSPVADLRYRRGSRTQRSPRRSQPSKECCVM